MSDAISSKQIGHPEPPRTKVWELLADHRSKKPESYPMDLLRLAYMELDPKKLSRILGSCGSVKSALAGMKVGRWNIPSAAQQKLRFSSTELLAPLEKIPAKFVDRLQLDPGVTEPSDPLLGLFVQGTLPADRGVAVVGTRRSTRYGLKLAEEIGRRLGRRGLLVVSGLALGIDAAVHKGMLSTRGRGVAVLGSGIGRWYPPSNQAIGEDLIAQGGAVVSEYPPDAVPFGWRFLHRNRLIAGLSEVVIVVEAPARSGALTTARLALEMGRDVLVVPGDIDRETSEGCNLLIQEGAHPITSLDDMEQLLGFRMGVMDSKEGSHTSGAEASGDQDGSIGQAERSVGKPSHQTSLLSADVLDEGLLGEGADIGSSTRLGSGEPSTGSVADLRSRIPPTGVSLEELVEPSELPVLLEEIGRLSALGILSLEGDMVYRN